MTFRQRCENNTCYYDLHCHDNYDSDHSDRNYSHCCEIVLVIMMVIVIIIMIVTIVIVTIAIVVNTFV